MQNELILPGITLLIKYLIHTGMKVSNHYSITVLFQKIILRVLAKFRKGSILLLADKYSIDSHRVLASSASIIKDSFGFIFPVYCSFFHVILWVNVSEWVNVSSGTGSPRLSRTNSTEL